MAPNMPKAVLSKEDRIARLKESRIKYSQISKAKNVLSKKPATTVPDVKPATKKIAAPVAAKKEIKRPPKAHIITEDDDFKSDPQSMAMITNCKVTMPTNRASVSGRQSMRPSIGGRGGTRFRESIANEPRQSLLPLGINVFEASQYQRNEVRDYLNAKIKETGIAIGNTEEVPVIKSFTPGRQKTHSVFSLNSSTSSTAGNNTFNRERKIRFMEEVIPEQRESADPSEIPTTSNQKNHHSPICDSSFMPTSILSSKRKLPSKRVNMVSRLSEDASSIDFDKLSTDDLVDKLDTYMSKISEVLLNRKLDDNKMEVINKAVEKVRRLNEIKIVGDALNETMNQESSFSVLQGPLKSIRTPKMKRVVSPQNDRPFENIINTLNSVEEESPRENDENDDEAPKVKKRRSSSLSAQVKPDAYRVLFRRRSTRRSVNNN